MSKIIDLSDKFLKIRESVSLVKKEKDLKNFSKTFFNEYINIRKDIVRNSNFCKNLNYKFAYDYNHIYNWNPIISILSEVNNENKFSVRKQILNHAKRPPLKFSLCSIRAYLANIVTDHFYEEGAFFAISESTKVCNKIAIYRKKMLKYVKEDDLLFFKVDQYLTSDFIFFSYIEKLILNKEFKRL